MGASITVTNEGNGGEAPRRYQRLATSFDWYIQDSWKATKKLTLEYGCSGTGAGSGNRRGAVAPTRAQV